jgi:hypothetical protein
MFASRPELATRVGMSSIFISVPERWTDSTSLFKATPRNIEVSFPSSKGVSVIVFSCYMTLTGDTLQVSSFGPAGILDEKITDKGIIEAYMRPILRELMRHARLVEANKIIVESKTSLIIEAFLDEGFKYLGQREGAGVYVGEYQIRRS